MPDLLILCYHAVSEDWPTEFSVRPAKLEAQLRFLTRRGYRPATLADALDRGADGKTVVVSFDDAYRSVIERGLPVLSRLGVPATVFVPTAYLGGDEGIAWSEMSRWTGTPFEEELECMSWEELRALAASGWEIGSHSKTHPDLTALGGAKLEAELRDSRAACEAEIQRPCTSLAYPFGAHDRRVRDAARAAGYEAGVTLDRNLAIPPVSLVRPGAEVDELGLLRAGVYRGDGWPRFLAKTSPLVRRARASRPLQKALRAS